MCNSNMASIVISPRNGFSSSKEHAVKVLEPLREGYPLYNFILQEDDTVTIMNLAVTYLLTIYMGEGLTSNTTTSVQFVKKQA